eukprot:751614-Hanusia_phi.AAC.3
MATTEGAKVRCRHADAAPPPPPPPPPTTLTHRLLHHTALSLPSPLPPCRSPPLLTLKPHSSYPGVAALYARVLLSLCGFLHSEPSPPSSSSSPSSLPDLEVPSPPFFPSRASSLA